MVHFCSLVALAHCVLPSANAGTLAPWCKGACVVVRIVFVQEGTPSCTKTILRGSFLFVCLLQNAAHIERENNKEK